MNSANFSTKLMETIIGVLLSGLNHLVFGLQIRF